MIVGRSLGLEEHTAWEIEWQTAEPEDLGVEVGAAIGVADVEHGMVESVDGHSAPISIDQHNVRNAAGLPGGVDYLDRLVATGPRGGFMDWKLELVTVPVADVDRAIGFYTDQAGFNLDYDHKVDERIRFVQLTPPGSACSIALGTGLSEAPPGSVPGLQLVVDDVDAAREQLAGKGVEVSEISDFPWGRFVYFVDPDGNRWAVQQIPER